MVNKQRLARVGLYSILTLSLLLASAKAVFERTRRKIYKPIVAVYGTLQNPTYMLAEDRVSSFPTFKQQLRSLLPPYDYMWDYIEAVPALEMRVQEAEGIILGGQQISDAEMEDLISGLQADKKYLHEMSTRELPDTPKEFSEFFSEDTAIRLGESLKRSYKESEAKYGDLRENVNKIFERLTGKKIPSFYLTIDFEEFKGSTIARQYPHLHGEAFSDKGYEESMLALFHERGHMCYQGDTEHGRTRGLFSTIKESFITGVNPQISIMEDAAADLFRICCAEEAQKMFPELSDNIRDLLFLDRIDSFNQYMGGISDSALQGFLLAESLVEYFKGDYAKAFNYICTRNRFDQLPSEVVRNYKSFLEYMLFDSSIIERKSYEMSLKTDELMVRYYQIAEAYNKMLTPN